MKTLLNCLRALSPNCRESARLQSELLEHPLPLCERTGLRLHLLLCGWCRRYSRQLQFLREAASRADEPLEVSPPYRLSPEARAAMKEKLREEGS